MLIYYERLFHPIKIKEVFSAEVSNVCPTSVLIFKMKTRCSVSYIYFLLLFLSFSCTSDGMFEWLFGKEKAGSSDNEAENGKEPIIRFEVLSSDEKFLDFATTLSDLSPLDACYHVVSVHKLRKQND